jgi:hypothetical protein
MTKYIDIHKEKKEAKKTVFDQWFDQHGNRDVTRLKQPEEFDKVIHLGYGVFVCYRERDRHPHFYSGIKGDEFDE